MPTKLLAILIAPFLSVLLVQPTAAATQPSALYQAWGESLWIFIRGEGWSRVELDRSVGEVADLAFDPSGRLLTWELFEHRLFAIDVATGEVEDLGQFEVTAEFEPSDVLARGLTVDACGRIFASTLWGRNAGVPYRLWRLDPARGTADFVGELPGNVGPLAAYGESIITFNPSDLYREPEVFQILEIDPATMQAEATDMSCPSVCTMGGLDVDAEGVLWMEPSVIPIMIPPRFPRVAVDLATFEVEEFELSYGGPFAIGPAGGVCLSGAPVAVPTASPWGLRLLGLLMAVAALLLLRRRSVLAGG